MTYCNGCHVYNSRVQCSILECSVQYKSYSTFKPTICRNSHRRTPSQYPDYFINCQWNFVTASSTCSKYLVQLRNILHWLEYGCNAGFYLDSKTCNKSVVLRLFHWKSCKNFLGWLHLYFITGLQSACNLQMLKYYSGSFQSFSDQLWYTLESPFNSVNVWYWRSTLPIGHPMQKRFESGLYSQMVQLFQCKPAALTSIRKN